MIIQLLPLANCFGGVYYSTYQLGISICDHFKLPKTDEILEEMNDYLNDEDIDEDARDEFGNIREIFMKSDIAITMK